MNKAFLAASAALALTLPASAQEAGKPAYPAPSEIVAAAPKSDWVAIPAEDLLVMTLAPDAEGKARQVVIQLMPAPFSQGWVHNIRLFARSGWYDGISVNRVQDNYVTQWGDPNYDNPEATGEPKPLPEGLKVMKEKEYVVSDIAALQDGYLPVFRRHEAANKNSRDDVIAFPIHDAYPGTPFHFKGWPLVLGFTGRIADHAYPTHCYGMVGVGRNYSPDTGSGAELYTVIGHAPRHLDRNIALVGRVIEGMDHLSSLPRGKGALGFYAADEADKRTPILSVRVASDLPASEQPRFEYLSTESDTFATYAEAIANRRDPFFIVPAGGADICNIRVPVRAVSGG
ncbi:peptidylprolyl isomerase [Erythrobacter dokdonensis]|nr:peptidylprolyl isomerase [Erythrobacter dokdonensis]